MLRMGIAFLTSSKMKMVGSMSFGFTTNIERVVHLVSK